MGYFETKLVQGAIGSRMRSMFSALGAFACAFAISFYYEWRLTLGIGYKSTTCDTHIRHVKQRMVEKLN